MESLQAETGRPLTVRFPILKVRAGLCEEWEDHRGCRGAVQAE